MDIKNSFKIEQNTDKNIKEQVVELNKRLNLAESKNIQLIEEIKIRDKKISELNQTCNTYIEQINKNAVEITSLYQNISVLQKVNISNQITNKDEVNEKINEFQKIINELNERILLQAHILNNISTSLRTPLNSIFGFIQFAESNQDEDAIKNDLISIKRSANKLNHILDNLILLSEIESKKRINKPQKIFVNQISNFISDDLFELAKIKKLDFDIYLNDTNTTFTADPALFHSVLYIILDNAINYTKKGFVRIETEKYVASGVETILIKIKDSGMGISKEKLEWIFKPNKPISEEKGVEYNYTSLSMAIAKKIVDEMNGDIGISSTLGKGTTVILQLPCN